MKRRAFCGTTLAGLPITGALAAPPKARAGDIPTTPLGRTGVEVQVIAQGEPGWTCTRTRRAFLPAIRKAAAGPGLDALSCHFYGAVSKRCAALGQAGQVALPAASITCLAFANAGNASCR